MLGLPALAYVLLVAAWPILQGVWYSLHDYNLLRPQRRGFVGFGNYLRLWADPSAVRALLNTFLFTFLAVGIELVLGLLLALALWRDGLFNRVALVLMLIPVTITPLAVGLIFRALLAVEFGLVGYWARELGLVGERGFFGYPHTAMGAIVMIDVWQWTPFVALILLAGLKALPGELLEAAEVDGATGFQRLRLIVLPLILPALLLALVLRTMDAFRVFDSVFVITKGGPEDATNVLMLYAVKQGLEFFNIGMGAATANVMLVCIALLAVLFVLLIRRVDRRIAGA
ncbi:MAG TPA: sugar ABC transporter permease [Geminicoccaceae bacterium]|nr:sugar ABC transporter permease [Geminicoccaceae bacterium]